MVALTDRTDRAGAPPGGAGSAKYDGLVAPPIYRQARKFAASSDAASILNFSPRAKQSQPPLRAGLAAQASELADGERGDRQHDAALLENPAKRRTGLLSRWTDPTGLNANRSPRALPTLANKEQPLPTLVERVKSMLKFNASIRDGVRESEAAVLAAATQSGGRERFWASAATVRRDPKATMKTDLRLGVVEDDARKRVADADADGAGSLSIGDFLLPSAWERARCFRHTAHFVERVRSDLRRGQSAGKALNQLAKLAALGEAQLEASESIFLALRDGGVDGPLCTRTSANLLAAVAILVEVNRVDVLPDYQMGIHVHGGQRAKFEGKQTMVVNLAPSDARIIASYESRNEYIFTDADRAALDIGGRMCMALEPMFESPPEGRFGERSWVAALDTSGTSRAHAVEDARRRHEMYEPPRDSAVQTDALDGMSHDSLNMSARRAVERHTEIREMARRMNDALNAEDAEAVEALVHECVNAAGRLCGADRASVWLKMANGREIYTHVLTGVVSQTSSSAVADQSPKNSPRSGMGGQVLRLPLYRSDGQPNGLVGECCTTGMPMLVADAREHHLFNADVDRTSGYVTKAVACHPLTSVTSIGLDVLMAGGSSDEDGTKGRQTMMCIGAIQVVNKKPSPLGYTEFTPRDLDVLAAYSICVASAVGGSRVLMQRKLLHGFALATSSLGLGSEREHDTNVVTATRRVVHELGNLLGADRTSLFLVDVNKRCLWAPLTGGKVTGMSHIVVPLVEDGAWCDPKERAKSPPRETLMQVASEAATAKGRRKAAEAKAEAERVKRELMRAKELRRGLAAHCVNDGVTIHVDDAQLDERFNRSVDEQTGYKTRSILCVPLRRSGSNQTFGVLQFVNKCRSLLGGPVFTSDDASVAEAISSVAATVLERAELREKMNNFAVGEGTGLTSKMHASSADSAPAISAVGRRKNHLHNTDHQDQV